MNWRTAGRYMLTEIKPGQKITLKSRLFKVVNLVNQDLVCLELLDAQESFRGMWIMGYDRVLRDAQPIFE
jgi:hypothetical protein